MTARCLWPGVGMAEPVMPGIYRDADGNLHFNVAELLLHLGAEDTPLNRDVVVGTLLGEAKRLGQVENLTTHG